MGLAQQLLLVAAGGAAGALSRFAVALWWVKQFGAAFPWATLVVNVLGCLCIGRFLNSSWADQESWRLVVTVGFLGSFTTFSAFGAETLHLLRNGKTGWAAAYVAASVLLGLAAVWMGWKLGGPTSLWKKP